LADAEGLAGVIKNAFEVKKFGAPGAKYSKALVPVLLISTVVQPKSCEVGFSILAIILLPGLT
jgi:hypothetical protein